MMGTNVLAPYVAQAAPQVGGEFYRFARPGFGWAPGRVLAGPYTDTVTTICLLPGDDGQWFKDIVSKADGKWWEEGCD